MSKAVMTSASPQECERIARGEQTMLVTKTMPKLKTPFKGYIYCTKAKMRLVDILKFGDENYGEIYRGKTVFVKSEVGSVLDMHGKRQKVIGEFVCDRIDEFHEWQLSPGGKFQEFEQQDLEAFLKASCLSYKEVCDYRRELPYFKPLYCWHISNLKIYDKPKELGEFRKTCDGFVDCIFCSRHIRDKYGSCDKKITRPPQSWQYVEELL